MRGFFEEALVRFLNPNPFSKFRKFCKQILNLNNTCQVQHSQQHLREPLFKIQKRLTFVQPQSSSLAGKKRRLRQNFWSLQTAAFVNHFGISEHAGCTTQAPWSLFFEEVIVLHLHFKSSFFLAFIVWVECCNDIKLERETLGAVNCQ